jgi:starch synthase
VPKVLAVASEAYPLVKTGGLADAVGALPEALAAQDIEVVTLIPAYRSLRDAVARGRVVLELPELFGGAARIRQARGVLALDAPHLFDRPGGPYVTAGGDEWGDNAIRFAALARAAAVLAQALGVDAVHAHDWQAGLVPAYLRLAPRRIPCLFTIHNMAYQGKFPAAVFPALGLPGSAFAREGLEYYGAVGFLKAGLWFADAINTVSPSYAEEILTPEGGMGLDGLLRGRAGDLYGILNGLDVKDWDPATDAALPARFSAGDTSPRAQNKATLQARFGLAPDPAAPLVAFVGRLAWQKGADLLLDAAHVLMQQGAQLALLGSGELPLEHACRAFAARHPGRAGAVIGFDEALARTVYGGADMLAVPSRFEPCGLAQLAALRYGAVPVVARTGGLNDTVIDASPVALAAHCATGVQVAPGRADALAAGLRRALALFQDGATWRAIQANGMATDVSWGPSAARYAAILKGLAARHG